MEIIHHFALGIEIQVVQYSDLGLWKHWKGFHASRYGSFAWSVVKMKLLLE